MDWRCVHIEHIRLSRPINMTFQTMLLDEYLRAGKPPGCQVYRRVHYDGSTSYYFTPEAAKALGPFERFWDAYECNEPPDLAGCESVL